MTQGEAAENSRSSSLAMPVRYPSATGRDAGSGKMSSSPRSSPSRIPTAAAAGEMPERRQAGPLGESAPHQAASSTVTSAGGA